MTRRLIHASVMTIIVVMAAGVASAGGMPEHLPRTDLLIVTTAGQRHAFRVRVATDPADRRRGLMFVDVLADDEGMLFDNQVTGYASMWMKNTPLSLDMLFIREDGTISNIVPETIPFSRKTIVSWEPVRFVLELRGGTTERLGIEAGDFVVHPLFEKPPG